MTLNYSRPLKSRPERVKGRNRPVDDFVAAQSLQVPQTSTEGHRGQGNSGNRYCEQKAWVKLVGAAGLEPATLCLEGGGCNVSQVPCFQMFSFQWDTRDVLRLVEPC